MPHRWRDFGKNRGGKKGELEKRFPIWSIGEKKGGAILIFRGGFVGKKVCTGEIGRNLPKSITN